MGIIHTPWKFFSEKGGRYRILAAYGIDYFFARGHSQDPSFSLMGRIEREGYPTGTWRDVRHGAIHEEIDAHFPELRKYLKWHLVSVKEPLHYLANAKYWWEKIKGVSQWPAQIGEPDPSTAFKETVIFGGLEGDREALQEAFSGNGWESVERWLKSRLEPLMLNFAKDMSELGVLE